MQEDIIENHVLPSPSFSAMDSTQAKKTKRQQRSNNIGQSVGHPERRKAERELGPFEEV